jgi:hypothetical protein
MRSMAANFAILRHTIVALITLENKGAFRSCCSQISVPTNANGAIPLTAPLPIVRVPIATATARRPGIIRSRDGALGRRARHRHDYISLLPDDFPSRGKPGLGRAAGGWAVMRN